MRGGRARTEPSGGAPRSFMNGPPRLSHIWKRRVDRQPIPARRSSVYARVCAPYVFIRMRVYLYMPTHIHTYTHGMRVFRYIYIYLNTHISYIYIYICTSYMHIYICMYVESLNDSLLLAPSQLYQPVLTNISIPTSYRSSRAATFPYLPPRTSIPPQELPPSLLSFSPPSSRLLSTPFTGDVELCDVDSRRATVVPHEVLSRTREHATEDGGKAANQHKSGKERRRERDRSDISWSYCHR